MRHFRSTQALVHFMAMWWVMWLALSVTPFNIFYTPSWQVTAQFAVFVLFFLAGSAMAVLLGHGYASNRTAGGSVAAPAPFMLGPVLATATCLCFGILLLSLYLSGALSESFIEYFTKLRRDEATGDSLTGSRLLDVATKAIVFPVSYTVTTIVLAIRIGPHRGVLAFSIVNVLLFAYLWQVNYPLMHLFWFFVFYVLVGVAHGSHLDRKTVIYALSLLALLVASASNRFGGDLLGAIERYVFGYHLAGFSFYDHHFHNPSSILHDHTFGRSSLGFLEQFLEIISRRIDLGFIAASSENATYNNENVELGAIYSIEGNAFGTFLFGFYRDFGLVGIAVGALLYGSVSTYLLARSRGNWAISAAFYVFASAWMVGMMVNPIEQVHFWFSIVLLWMLSKVNRGFKL